MTRREQPGGNSPRRWREQRHPANPESDYLLEAVEDNWRHVLAVYRQFEEKKPIVLYDIQEKRIHDYPNPDFLSELSEKSQLTLKDQDERAVEDNKIVVFVRDNEQRRLVSFSMDYE
jgi:hypothetical protein